MRVQQLSHAPVVLHIRSASLANRLMAARK
jgi:hypothetical protein